MSEENNKEAADTPKPEKEAKAVAKPAAAAKEAPAKAPAKDAAPKAEKKAEEAPATDKAAADKVAAEKDAPKKDEKKKDIFAEIAGGEEESVKIHKAKGSKNVATGIVHVTATFNNTLVSVTDPMGNSIGWSSAGKMGFKGSRKSTAYAAQVVSQDACRQAMSHGLKTVEVRVKGPGAGRESAVRAAQGLGLEISKIKDVTAIPHNGCRPKKARRV
jgi:small subunit ribosomal protein S11|tara:strand:- start:14118 stop:14765 length:648 start_codon:yes stop_codon:yes gene_type:complete